MDMACQTCYRVGGWFCRRESETRVLFVHLARRYSRDAPTFWAETVAPFARDRKSKTHGRTCPTLDRSFLWAGSCMSEI